MKNVLVLVGVLVLMTKVMFAAEPGVNLLDKARETALEMESVSYEFVYHGSGSLAGTFSGEVKLAKAANPVGALLHVAIDVPDPSEPGRTRTIAIASDGSKIQLADPMTKIFSEGTAGPGTAHLLNYAYYAVIFQFVQPNPFQPELAGGNAKIVGEERVAGVECRIVESRNDSFGGAKVWWWIGTDGLPRKQRWVVDDGKNDGEFLFTMSNLHVNPKLAVESFRLTKPEGFEYIDEDRVSVAAGAEAPGFELPSADGKQIDLSSFRGKVVVLDFWASWCPPCEALMPAFQKIADENPDVVFLGVNAWESPTIDPAEYARKKGVRYPILLEGESLAGRYRLRALPALFVVGRDGKLLLVENPIGAAVDEVPGKIRSVLELVDH